MTEKITASKALGLLAAAVEQKGGSYVYEKPTVEEYGFFNQRCVYAHDGQPSCLVGQALHLAGIDVTKLENTSAVLLRQANPDDLENVSDGALQVFQIAQSLQDKGYTWAAAYDAAEALVENDIVRWDD